MTSTLPVTPVTSHGDGTRTRSPSGHSNNEGRHVARIHQKRRQLVCNVLPHLPQFVKDGDLLLSDGLISTSQSQDARKRLLRFRASTDEQCFKPVDGLVVGPSAVAVR